MEYIDRTGMGYCIANAPENVCQSTEQQRFLCAVFQATCAYPTDSDFSMPHTNLRRMETLHDVWHSFWTIAPVVYFFATARLAGQLLTPKTLQRFVLEFAIIAVPSIVCINIINEALETLLFCFTAIFLLLLALQSWRMGIFEKLRARSFDLGHRRPAALTLDRTAINFLTVICILAVDFECFPTEFRKSRRFGAGLMDTGIGLFVFAMGSVSRPVRKVVDLRKMMRIVVPLLLLGIARTVVIMAIDYEQDVHEYGAHLNAFFTLGLTKLFGGLISVLAQSKGLMLPLGLVVLSLHELALQLGISEYVMNENLSRDDFLNANREGLCSLPGFVALYIISIKVGQWLQSNKPFTFNEFKEHLLTLTALNIFIWVMTVVSILLVGIARVTCNMGYVVWILAIAISMTLLFTIMFHLILDTFFPVKEDGLPATALGGGESGQLLKGVENLSGPTALPELVEAINFNGLLFFLVANVLTGCVNMFLSPHDRNDYEAVITLTLYLLISIGFNQFLYRAKMRIA